METLDAMPLRPWCLFRSDSQPFAVALESVAEVVEADRLVRLSHCPPQVLGLCAVRRDIVPVVCLNPRSVAEEWRPESKLVVLILRTEHGTWGIRIDREGTAVVDGDLDEAGAGPATAGSPAVLGSLRRGGMAHPVIDPGQTWSDVRDDVERWYRQ